MIKDLSYCELRRRGNKTKIIKIVVKGSSGYCCIDDLFNDAVFMDSGNYEEEEYEFNGENGLK